MKVDKSYPGLMQLENGSYKLIENLTSDESIDIDLDRDLRVVGDVSSSENILVKKSLSAHGSIKADGDIDVGGNIETPFHIVSGGYIKAAGDIKTKTYLKAGSSIEADGSINAGERYLNSVQINEPRKYRALTSVEAGAHIKAGKEIKARRSIHADGYIEATGNIETYGDIEAGEHIKAGKDIVSGDHIKSQSFVDAGWRAISGTRSRSHGYVECSELRGGEIGRGELKITAPPEQQAQVSEPSEDENSFLSV